MLNSHVSFATIAMCRHVKGIVVVSQSGIVLPLVDGHDSAVEMAEVDSEPESIFTGSGVSIFVGMVEFIMLFEYLTLLGEPLFLGALAC